MPFLGKTPQQFVDPEVDIDGGSIDGTAIGATSASTATVTTFTSTGIDDNASSTAITIDSSQNVGIGTASPTEQLHIANANDAVVLVESTGSDATDDANIQLKTTNGTFTLQNDRSLGTTGALTVAGATSNNIVVDHTSGNVGIGTTSPSTDLDVRNNISMGDGTSVTQLSMTRNSANYIAATNASGYLVFRTGGNNERMRLDSSGNLLVGTTAAPLNGVAGVRLSNPAVATPVIGVSGTSFQYMLSFHNANGYVGAITTSSSSTAYNTSSDYRLKENVVSLDDATDRLKQIPVHRFNFIADPDTTVDGFLAHEVASIVPEAVSGKKDAVDKDGNPVYQGIDQSKLVPLLTAALQEALTKIDDLQTRLSALEAN